MFETEHIKVHLDNEGRVLVTMDDLELYDYVEDHLTEIHDLEYMSVQHDDDAGLYTITYAGDLATRVQAALLELDAGEIHRIWLLNNAERGS